MCFPWENVLQNILCARQTSVIFGSARSPTVNPLAMIARGSATSQPCVADHASRSAVISTVLCCPVALLPGSIASLLPNAIQRHRLLCGLASRVVQRHRLPCRLAARAIVAYAAGRSDNINRMAAQTSCPRTASCIAKRAHAAIADVIIASDITPLTTADRGADWISKTLEKSLWPWTTDVCLWKLFQYR